MNSPLVTDEAKPTPHRGAVQTRYPSPRGPWGERLSTFLLCLALVAGILIFLGVVHDHYPVDHWLVWRYLIVAALSGFWAISCAAVGCFLLVRLGVRSCHGPSDLVLAFPVGVLAFQLAIFLLGLPGLLGGLVFALLPLAFLLLGARPLYEAARGLWSMVPARTLPDLAVILFGISSVALLYFQILSPESFSWDARWYHLPLAQQYALTGTLRAFPEGWWLAAYPHSASLVYTWAFLLPAGALFDKLELCAHLELVVFLATIASIPALVRALVPRTSARQAWVAIFLFPGIFLYDGNLHAGADHMAALWCIPLTLALIQVWRSWAPRDGILFGTLVAAVILSKYSAWSILLFPSCLFLLRGGWLALRRPRGGKQALWGTLLGCGAAVLIVSAPHWLKNWLWFGDPLYPVFYRWLHVHPWSSAESPASFRVFLTFTTPPSPGWEGVKDALLSTITFSFKPNDWWSNHRDVPIFGSLFTLTLMCLPFVKAGVRLWLAYAGAMVAIVVWYLSNHQDRLLQAWVPFMAATTAAVLILIWQRRRLLPRILVCALVAAQIAWGGDVPFLPTHNLVNDSPIRANSSFVASGFTGKAQRLRPYGAYGEIGELLPRDARLLLHEINLQMGFGVVVVNDQWQGRIAYSTLKSPLAIYGELASLKITHMVWYTDHVTAWNAVGSDLAFMSFVLNYAEEPVSIGEFTVARFPQAPPASGMNDKVVMLTCENSYQAGIYRLDSLLVPEPDQPWASPESEVGDLQSAVRDAGFLVVEPRCNQKLPDDAGTLFHSPISRESLKLYARKLN